MNGTTATVLAPDQQDNCWWRLPARKAMHNGLGGTCSGDPLHRTVFVPAPVTFSPMHEPVVLDKKKPVTSYRSRAHCVEYACCCFRSNRPQVESHGGKREVCSSIICKPGRCVSYRLKNSTVHPESKFRSSRRSSPQGKTCLVHVRIVQVHSGKGYLRGAPQHP
jgi:hypothetical protein